MPIYIVLALLSMLLMAGVDFLFGMAARKKISYATMMCCQFCSFLPASAIFAYWEGQYAWTSLNMLGAATAVLILVAYWSLMRSVSLGELSTSAPIYRINFVVAALIAILFMGESMTFGKAIGFLSAAFSIFLISEFQFSRQRFREMRLNSILWATVAMLAMGITNVIFKVGLSLGLAPAMFIHSQAFFFAGLSILYAYIQQGGPRFSRLGWVYGLTIGLGNLLGILALVFALRIGEVSIVTPIAQLSFVVSVLMATLWMREHITVRKIFGLLLAIGTVIAFSVPF
jgi:uncharacterized membrane protein